MRHLTIAFASLTLISCAERANELSTDVSVIDIETSTATSPDQAGALLLTASPVEKEADLCAVKASREWRIVKLSSDTATLSGEVFVPSPAYQVKAKTRLPEGRVVIDLVVSKSSGPAAQVFVWKSVQATIPPDEFKSLEVYCGDGQIFVLSAIQ